jgi:FkbM family methyltransferase
MSVYRKVRFEVARRVNRLKAQRNYRFTSVAAGDRVRVVMRNGQGVEREISLRRGQSDLPGFLQIFEELQYDTSGIKRHQDIVARYQAILDRGEVPLIVDCGANVGLSALYFREIYPQAKILAIEPEESNFRELQARADEMIVPINGGLASFDGHLETFDPGLGEMGFRTRKADDGVPAFRLDSLLDQHDGVPFILKIDIEGFEADLFDDPALLDRFMVIFFEPHDWMLPRQRTASSFVKAVAGLDRDFLISGENILSIANH